MITVSEFGRTKDGKIVNQYVLENSSGMKAVVLDYGAVLQSLFVPDRDGKLRDVVWGYEDVAHYEGSGTCFGANVGRNANRIGNAKVRIGEKEYFLEENDGRNNLHSGSNGYHLRMWEAVVSGEDRVDFSIVSPDGDQGFPGNAKVTVSYRLTEENELQIYYRATADKDTIFNMTNHSYFNLEGQASDNVLNQEVYIGASAFTPTDDTLIPTGEIRSVKETPMDFRKRKALGIDIDASYEPLKQAGGYDHNFVLDVPCPGKRNAELYSQESGIVMELFTDQPGIQMYTANSLNDEEGGKGGKIYGKSSAVCFEPQCFPDAPHHDNFPSTVVKAGEEYSRFICYRFSCSA